MREQLKKTDIKTLVGTGCLIVISILSLLFLYQYNQIEKECYRGTVNVTDNEEKRDSQRRLFIV